MNSIDEMYPIGFVIIVFAITLIIAICIPPLIELIERRRRRQTMRVTKIIQSHKNPDIIGDGAWITTPAAYPPRSARVRDIDPMGA